MIVHHGGDGGDRPPPEFSTEMVDGVLVVHVSRRNGATDDELARAARKQAKLLAPVRVHLDDDYRPHVHHEPWPMFGLDSLQVGAKCVFHADEDRQVWKVDGRWDPTEAQVKKWIEKGADGDEGRATFVAEGGTLVHFRLTREDGVVGTITLADGYGGYPITLIPESDHWPRCNSCRQPWPCQHTEKARADERAEAHEMSRCHRCGGIDGNQHVFRRRDGFLERRIYHTRKGPCLAEAIRYANGHGWMMVEASGWRGFRKAPDDAGPLDQRITPGPKKRQAGKVHYGVATDDDRTVPMCGAAAFGPALAGTVENVTCDRCQSMLSAAST